MCTVTYLPGKDEIFFTSNRDEKQFRSQALQPHIYTNLLGKIMYPRDPDAGGTWIAVHERGHAMVLLNGGFEGHLPDPPYRRSRGQIVLDFMACVSPAKCFKDIDLAAVEPFTAVIWDQGQLLTCVWDGMEKHTMHEDTAKPHIWSSSTLYSREVRRKRSSWFSVWQQDHPSFDQKDIIDFHRFSGDGDTYNDLLMNRDGKVFTVSITSLAIKKDQAEMIYLDLKDQKSYIQKIRLSTSQSATFV